MIGTQTQAQLVAEAFSLVLGSWLSKHEFADMKRLNETDADYRDGSVCASHDFCDANMAMDAAFQQVLGREPNVVGEGAEVEADCALWSEAWKLARKLYLGTQLEQVACS